MRREGRRLRGLLIRFVQNRRAAIIAGAFLLTPAIWLAAVVEPWESWYTDAIGLICGATGAALLVAGASGRQPDWIEPKD